MGFLTDLFDKKPGGTTFGNLFRNIVPGGGSKKPSQVDVDIQALTEDEFKSKYGVDKKGVSVPPNGPTEAQVALYKKNSVSDSDKKFFQKTGVKMVVGILGIGAAIALVVYMIKKVGKKRRY